MPKIKFLGAGINLELTYPESDKPVTLDLLLKENGKTFRPDVAYRTEGGGELKADSEVVPDSTIHVGKRSTSG